jgi:hypothetical protein
VTSCDGRTEGTLLGLILIALIPFTRVEFSRPDDLSKVLALDFVTLRVRMQQIHFGKMQMLRPYQRPFVQGYL